MVLLELFGAILGLVLWISILYFTVKAAVAAAQRPLVDQQRSLAQIETAHATLTQQLVKHLVAQTELMLAQARHQGMTDEQLASTIQQVAERRADPTFSLPFA